jgi:hypothetical protein
MVASRHLEWVHDEARRFQEFISSQGLTDFLARRRLPRAFGLRLGRPDFRKAAGCPSTIGLLTFRGQIGRQGFVGRPLGETQPPNRKIAKGSAVEFVPFPFDERLVVGAGHELLRFLAYRRRRS